MTRNSSLIKFTKLLRESIEHGRWKQVDAARERLVQLGLDALVERSADDLHIVSVALTNARSMMVLEHNVNPRREADRQRNADAEAWMLTAEASVMIMAERLLPAQPAALTSDEQRRGRDAILIALSRCNQRSLSNTALADSCRLRPETIARVLGVLRQEGLVVSWRAGRTVANQVTSRGREEAHRLETGMEMNEETSLPILASHCGNFAHRLEERVTGADGGR